MAVQQRKASSTVKRRTPPEAEERARQIVANCPDAMLVTSLDRSVLAANVAAADLFERSLDDLIGMHLEELVVAEEREPLLAYERNALEGYPQRYETRIITSPGDEHVVAVAAAALFNGDRVIGMSATFRHMAEDDVAHDKLAPSEARYRLLFETASDAIATLDASGRFTTVNQAAEHISGYTREELIGKSFVPMQPKDEVEKTLKEFQRALAGENGEFETTFLRKGGELRYISVTYSCTRLGEEVQLLIRDVTEEKQLQEQLIQTEKMAAIGQLVSGVAHELNNPLASISAFAQLLLAERQQSSEQRHSAQIIADEAGRAARIVNNLLTLARQHKAEKMPADINKVLDEALELRAYELRVHGVDLVREYDPDVPESMVDVFQLQQVFLNLLTNAEQAMAAVDRQHHRLTVRTCALYQAVRVEIEDTGPGVPPDALDRIFDPFFTTKPAGTGTGLGLSISLGIVRQHGGRIWAENLPVGGSRFSVWLPTTTPEYQVDSAEYRIDAASRPGLRILVVDDEEPIRIALRRYLKGAGHEVAAAASGNHALALVARETFDAIVLDIRMPDMSGQQLFEQLSEEKPDLAERVIFISGDTVSTDLHRFLRRTGRPFIAKPFDFTAIAEALPETKLAD